MGLYQIYREQKIPAGIDEIWDFISSPKNLKRITPAHMGFDITTKNLPEKMYSGMMISYKVRPLLGIPMTWVTEISHVEEKKFFVDEQRVGPYRIWHHEHRLEPIEGGSLMKDLISYKPPLGIMGALANPLLIKPSLDKIFHYREMALIELFGNFEDPH